MYLNTGWSGPSSTDVVEAMRGRAVREAYDGPTAPDVRFEKAELVRGVRERVARLIGADLDEIALMYTTAEGLNTALRGLGLGPGDEVLTCNLEHNAVMVPSYYARLRDGNRTRDNASDETPGAEPCIVERGTRLPVREICELAHARGALVCVDAAQSVGHIAFDVREMGCDILAMPGHKWLLGPDGAAFLYVRRDLIERLQPLAVVHGANRHYDYRGNFDYANDSIHKFELTTHSGPVLAGLSVAIDAATSVGLPAIEAHCIALADRFIEGLQRIDGVRFTTPLDPSVRSAIVTFAIGELNPHECTAALWGLDRIVVRACNDARLRACFAAFNDDSDVGRALAAVERVARNGIPAGTPSAVAWTSRMRDAED